MNYPLNLRFKIVSFSSKIFVTDSSGQLLCFVKKKALKLKEHVTVFADEAMTHQLCEIKADRVIDFSAQYSFLDPNGQDFGGVARKGMRSIFKANYVIQDSDNQPVMEIHEESAWVKVMDSLLGEIPILGMFTGYFFNPSYIVQNTAGEDVFRVKKQPAFFEGMYEIEKLGEVDEGSEMRSLMAVIMMLMLERYRG